MGRAGITVTHLDVEEIDLGPDLGPDLGLDPGLDLDLALELKVDEEIEMKSIPVTRNGVTTYTEPLPVHVAGSGPAPAPEATRRIVGAFLGEGWARTRKLGRLREYLRQSGTRLDTSRLDLETEMELHHGC